VDLLGCASSTLQPSSGASASPFHALGACHPGTSVYSKSQLAETPCGITSVASKTRTNVPANNCSSSALCWTLKRSLSSLNRSVNASLPHAPTTGTVPPCSPSQIASAFARVAPAPFSRRQPPPTPQTLRPWRSEPCRSRGSNPLWSGAWSHASAGLERAPRRRFAASEPHISPPAAPQPALEPRASESANAPSPSTSHHETLELEVAELRLVVASLEAEREEHRLRLRLLELLARSATRPPAPPAEPLLADGTPVARALAEKDARIAQLRFEIEDRSARRLAARLSLASAFFHDPANQLAAQPPAAPAVALSPPRTKVPSSLPGEASPSPPPPPPARLPAHFSWGLGLARGTLSQDSDQLIRPARTVLTEPSVPAPISTSPPWA
jgi:hypothetical protein